MIIHSGDGNYYALFRVIMKLCSFIELAIQTLFFVLVSTATLLFDELDDRISSSRITSFRLNRWKGHYDLVCQFVGHINTTFGLILLIVLLNIIIDMTFYIYQFIYAFREVQFGIEQCHYLIYFYRVFSRILTISLSSWNIRNKVNVV